MKNLSDTKEGLMCRYARNGDIDSVKFLIDSGVDVNFSTKIQESEYIPLLSAVVGGKKKMAMFLLDNGADSARKFGEIEGRVDSGVTIFDMCLSSDNLTYLDKIEIIALMIEKQPYIAGDVLDIISDPDHVQEYFSDLQNPQVVDLINNIKVKVVEQLSTITNNSNQQVSTLRQRNVKGLDEYGRGSGDTESSEESIIFDDNEKIPSSKIKANRASTATSAVSVTSCNVM